MYDLNAMESKDDRHAAIRQLVQTQRVTTQARIIAQLRVAGMYVDQSTLSRDLVEIGIRKTGGRYLLPREDRAQTASLDVAPAVTRFTVCGSHLVVLHTPTGLAQPVAVAIDEKQDPSITSTVAGDDTIFVAVKSRKAQTVALRRLKQWFGDKYER